MRNQLNVDRLARVMSEILSEKYGADIKIEYVPKDQAEATDEPEKTGVSA